MSPVPAKVTLGCLALCCLALGGHEGAGRAAAGKPGVPPATPATYRWLARQVQANLQNQVLGMWYPRAVDRAHGGFSEDFRDDWSRGAGTDKSLVYQSRLTWVAAQAARRFPQQAAAYRGDARHGLDFLARVLWDRPQGGLFWAVDPQGRPDTARGTEKHVYGLAFGIYAACAAYRATHDARALALAKRDFLWLDGHAHDARHGGYYEALTRAGSPLLTPPDAPGAPRSDAIGTPYGEKSMNSHIHLLEAVTALDALWPDPRVHRRLQELFTLVRDRIAAPPGYLNMFFTPAWKPISDTDSFGHDVETAYLLTEAAAALGRPNDSRTWGVARRLVDHALRYGWDTKNGGFFDQGRAGGAPTRTEKIWWEQAEGLNALLLMHARFGRETPRYWAAFARQWEFIQTRQIDHRHGGWYPTVSRDGAPVPGQGKSDAWTDPYHQARALMNVSACLRRLAGDGRSAQKGRRSRYAFAALPAQNACCGSSRRNAHAMPASTATPNDIATKSAPMAGPGSRRAAARGGRAKCSVAVGGRGHFRDPARGSGAADVRATSRRQLSSDIDQDLLPAAAPRFASAMRRHPASCATRPGPRRRPAGPRRRPAGPRPGWGR